MDYWVGIRRARTSRRRALAAASGAAVAAAILIACGGADGPAPATKKDKSGLLTQPVDETKSVKRGGTYKIVGADLPNLDPYLTNNGTLNRVYNQFFHIKGGLMEPSKGVVEGDLGESWEFSPDKLQLTIKLTDKAHFAPLQPVNGRAPDTDDVLYSYQRLKAIGTRREELANDINPEAPVTSISAPDKRTVVVKFNEPLSTALNLFANWTQVNLFIVPKESEDQRALDLRRQFLGTGHLYLAEYTPSVRLVYKKNPGFGQDPRGVPYMDGMELPVIPEYAAGLAQFKAGALHSFAVRAEDILQTKNDVPALEMIASDLTTERSRSTFGYLPGSAFLDTRLRQAWSLSWDRDLFIDVFFNVSKFEAEGLPMQSAWNTSFQAESWEGWWLDPKGKEFGPNAKYFQHDLAEAKKLLTAASYANGIDTNARWAFSGGYGAAYNKAVEIIQGMVQEAGFRIKNIDANFNTDFREIHLNAGGRFEGVSFIQSFSAGLDPVIYLYRWYNSKGSNFRGFDLAGKGDKSGDPTMDDLTSKMRREFDEKKRQALVLDFQRYDAGKMYYMSFPGGANSFTLAWPAVRGRQVWRGEGQRDEATFWLDQTKAPFKAS